MAVASYVSDLTDITLAESTTDWSAYGGGGAGLSAGEDFAMEGTYAIDKKIDATTKGFCYDYGSPITPGTWDHFYFWTAISTPGICADLRLTMGDESGNLYRYMYVAQSDGPTGTGVDYPYFDLAGDVYALRMTEGSPGSFEDYGDGQKGVDLDGTDFPSDTPQFFGMETRMTDGVKSPNTALDAIRYGTGYDVTGGTGADPEANFAGVFADDSSTSEGIVTALPGGYKLQGRLRIGSASTACEFLDSNLLIASKVTGHAKDLFTAVLIEHADTIVNFTNVTFLGLTTYNRGRFEVLTSAAEVNLTGCTFQDYGKTVLGNGSTCHNCNWINADIVTANGADLTGSLIRDYATADSTRSNEPSPSVVDTSPLIWDVNTDPDGLLDSMTFIKGVEATHAIEFGTTSPTSLTLNEIDFSGYHADNGEDDSTFHIKRTSGTVTITLYGCTGNFSYKTAGATVIIIDNPVTIQLHVIAQAGGADIENARAYVVAAATGPLPYQDSVNITRVTTTASVAHTDHGLSDGDKVLIEGADQDEYNGVQTISNVTTSAYDYTVSGSPTTPATGTIISTAVIIDGLTDSGGLISDTRTYSADQDFSGRVRRSSATPFYKTSKLTGTIDEDNGINLVVQMVLDE